MRKYFLIVLTFTLAFVACKKEETKLSNLELLTAHKWKYTTMTETDGVTVENLLTADACESDDLYEFTSSLQLIIYTGEKRCYSAQEAIDYDTFTLNDNQDSLYFSDLDPFFIKSITKDKMIWESKYLNGTKELTCITEFVPE